MSETLIRLKVQTIIEGLEDFDRNTTSDEKVDALHGAKKLLEQLREVEEIDTTFSVLLEEALGQAITKAIYS